MRNFTPEAAEQVIGLLCYSRTEDRYDCGCSGENRTGAFRLAVTVTQQSNRLALSDRFSLSHQTITIIDALKRDLLEPSWEDLAAKLYLNDQDILYMCLTSSHEPVCLRLIDAIRIIAYRNRHTERAKAKKFTYSPGQREKQVRLAPGKAGFSPPGHERTGEKNPRDRTHYAA